ncbi:MAG: putative baseplate assembly protein [Desulfosarcina sp.]|nr:putative baseplate assembly protein [Desulfobacterales bacterium]
MPIESPKIDKRDFEDLLKEMKSLVSFYTPEWKPSEKDAGITLIKIFNHMLETIIHRLNRVPDKNFTAFLDTLGIKLLPSQPAIVPITFSLSGGSKEHVLIPAMTRMAAGDLFFETKKNILTAPFRLIKAYSIDVEDDGIYESPTNVVSGKPAASFQTKLLYDAKKEDKEIFLSNTEGLSKGDTLIIEKSDYGIVSEISDSQVKLLHKIEYDHTADSLVEKITSFELFKGKNLQEHILYLGHEDLFNIKGKAEFKLTISDWNSKIADNQLVSWQYWGESKKTKVIGWHDFGSPDEQKASDTKNNKTENKLILEKNNNDEINERELNEIKSRWIRCKFKKSKILDVEGIDIDTIKIAVQPIEEIAPDMIFYNDVPLEIPKKESPIYPFGTRPRQLDTFYIGSQETFSKKNAKVTITFDIDSKVDSNIPAVKVHGVGKEFEGRLREAKIDTVGKLLKLSKDELKDILKKENGTKTESYYSTKAINILEAARKGFYDKSRSSGTASKNENGGDKEPILSWEYWNGKGWKVIKKLNGYEFKFLENGGVEFTCPEDIDAVKVAGQENYWIRVRIISGDYGRELDYDGENWVPGQINPPIIGKITIDYEVETPINLEHCLTYNNLEYKDVSVESQRENKNFKPFQPLDDEHKTLYPGFDKKFEKGPISIFLSFEEQKFLKEDIPKIEWYYYSQKKQWVGLEVLDNTENFTRTGTVEFFIPDDFAATSKFGNEIYWIKAVDIEDKIQTSPKAKGIYINTTFATQAESIEDEILGSSDVSANQKFQFTKAPVITEKIWVNEIATLSGKEKKSIMEENGKGSILESKDETGKTTDVWVRWEAVEDFFESAPKSRHYVVERATGEAKFGDGVHGMIPPFGRDNIKATYQVGGGVRGNVGASEISTLKTSIPFADRVTNPEAAEGGSDTESLEAVFERGPHLIKHRDRAVTEEDFERLAKAASSYIARSKCFTKENKLKIIIIPKGEEDKPTPSLGLIRTVEKHLVKRSLNLILPESIEVQKPSYREVSITVDVVPESIDLAIPLEKEILKRLKEFFHPLTGGPEKSGWEFGRDVHISDVYALLEGIKGVDYVEKLILKDDYKSEDVKVEEFETVCSGVHKITMKIGVK